VTTLIRSARANDAAALKAILYDTFESTWRPAITAAAAEAFVVADRPAAYIAARGANFWVAERGGVIVGLCDWQDDFVNALHVLGGHARTGVGQLLMDKAEAAIAAAGFEAARLETDTFNTRARRFYAGRGYAEIDQYPDLEWGSGLTTVLLRKSLR
jgi:ribosomal protein S18 acetylase RimI-like enzyme